jgi:hypothetical protein
VKIGPATGARTIVLMALAGVLLGGCAQPGQLGSALPASEPAPAAAAGTAPGLPAASAPGPGLFSSGLVEDGVSMRSTGAAEFAVATIVLAPGESTPWHRHPGTEVSARALR